MSHWQKRALRPALSGRSSGLSVPPFTSCLIPRTETGPGPKQGRSEVPTGDPTLALKAPQQDPERPAPPGTLGRCQAPRPQRRVVALPAPPGPAPLCGTGCLGGAWPRSLVSLAGPGASRAAGSGRPPILAPVLSSRRRPAPLPGGIWAGGLLRVGSHTPPPAKDIHLAQKARVRQQTHSPWGCLGFVCRAQGPRGHLGSSRPSGRGGGSP